MNNTITAAQLIDIVEKSKLDPTIKEILVRDIKNEGVNEFLVEQVIAYCDDALATIKKTMENKNPA